MKASDFMNVTGAFDLSEAAQRISSDVKEYLLVAEQEQTKRAQISADYNKEIAKIEAVRSLFEQFLNRSFDERRKNFEELFKLIRESMQRGDNTILGQSLEAVVQLAKISPLAEAKSLESLRSAMDDPDHEFNL